MVERWNTVRAEAVEEARLDAQQEAAPSIEVLEERKRKRIAEWRGGVSGADTERNNNFVEVGGDWRERVRAAKQRRGEQAPPGGSTSAA